MKKLMIAVSALLLLGCSKAEKKLEEKSPGFSNLVKGAQNYSKINSSINDVSKNIDKLKAMTPLNNEELKAVLPEQIQGLKRTELSVGDNAMMQIASAEAKYSDGEGKRIKLEVMDGAGETGSAMVSMLMIGLNVNKEKITETGFEKSTEINGSKAIVSENINGDQVSSKIQMVAKDRYLLTLSGTGFSYDELNKALGEIDMSRLQ